MTAILSAVGMTPSEAPIPVSKNPGETVLTRAKSFHSTARDLERWMTAEEGGGGGMSKVRKGSGVRSEKKSIRWARVGEERRLLRVDSKMK
jgi:hypothetical protein